MKPSQFAKLRMDSIERSLAREPRCPFLRAAYLAAAANYAREVEYEHSYLEVAA